MVVCGGLGEWMVDIVYNIIHIIKIIIYMQTIITTYLTWIDYSKLLNLGCTYDKLLFGTVLDFSKHNRYYKVYKKNNFCKTLKLLLFSIFAWWSYVCP